MFDDLKTYFNLVSNFRTSHILTKKLVLEDALPALARKTSSVRLKDAISKFLLENAHVLNSDRRRQRS